MNFFGTVVVIFFVIPFSFSSVWESVPKLKDVAYHAPQRDVTKQNLEFPGKVLVSMNVFDRRVIKFNSSMINNSTNLKGSGVHELECLNVSSFCRERSQTYEKNLRDATIIIYVFLVGFLVTLLIVELYNWIKAHMMTQIKGAGEEKV